MNDKISRFKYDTFRMRLTMEIGKRWRKSA